MVLRKPRETVPPCAFRRAGTETRSACFARRRPIAAPGRRCSSRRRRMRRMVLRQAARNSRRPMTRLGVRHRQRAAAGVHASAPALECAERALLPGRPFGARHHTSAGRRARVVYRARYYASHRCSSRPNDCGSSRWPRPTSTRSRPTGATRAIARYQSWETSYSDGRRGPARRRPAHHRAPGRRRMAAARAARRRRRAPGGRRRRAPPRRPAGHLRDRRHARARRARPWPRRRGRDGGHRRAVRDPRRPPRRSRTCDARNDAVQALLARAGMRQESRQVDADWCKGEWTTVDGFAVLRGEWLRR